MTGEVQWSLVLGHRHDWIHTRQDSDGLLLLLKGPRLLAQGVVLLVLVGRTLWLFIRNLHESVSRDAMLLLSIRFQAQSPAKESFAAVAATLTVSVIRIDSTLMLRRWPRLVTNGIHVTAVSMIRLKALAGKALPSDRHLAVILDSLADGESWFWEHVQHDTCVV